MFTENEVWIVIGLANTVGPSIGGPIVNHADMTLKQY